MRFKVLFVLRNSVNERDFFKTSSEFLAKRVANLVQELNFRKGELEVLRKMQKTSSS
jgi:hypothetical protein